MQDRASNTVSGNSSGLVFEGHRACAREARTAEYSSQLHLLPEKLEDAPRFYSALNI